MRTLSRLEMGLSCACGCLVVALMVALYWLFWWMKSSAISRGLLKACRNKPGREILLRFLLWKKNRASSSGSTVADPCSQICSSSVIITVDRHEESASGSGGGGEEEECVKDNYLWGPPWVLFTIREETEEEMKSAEERSTSTGRRRALLAGFLEGCPKSEAPASPKMKSLKVGEKTFSVPFHPPPPVVASSGDKFDGSFITIIVE
ncbi:hypothetical protein KSP40_PGU011381 [Platanthera guangdongensis]|uniref:ATP synthase F0 subunit 8 n=1 Tax=Platanthera guangdongensis TaxID=2320717 RepID=A0ABR2LCS2_9ASPA